MKEKYEQKINMSKELISSQPTNNLKNLSKKIEFLDKMSDEYKTDLLKIKGALEKFISQFNNIQINSNIEICDNNIKEVEEKLYLLNTVNTPFEKLGLDIICYNIRNHENNNLEYINNNIMDAISIFNVVGLKTEEIDFNYSVFVNTYIKELLNNNDISNLKQLFEKLYWQSPNIIQHIELTIKHIYLKNIKRFNKYIDSKINELSIDITNLYNEYITQKIKYDNLINKDTYLNFNKFKNKELKISDYSIEKIDKIKSQFSDSVVDEENFKKLYNDVIEYKGYIKYKFIIDDIKKLYNEKDKYKNAYKSKLKEISKLEKKLKSYNKKYIKANSETTKNEIKININEFLDNLRNLYIELEDCKFNEYIYNNVSNKTTIREVLSLATSYYIYFNKCLKKSDIDENVIVLLNDLKQYLLSPYNTIINTVTINDEYDYPKLISDKNVLMNMNISEDLLEESNIDNLIENLNLIINFYNLNKMKIKIEDIDVYLNVYNTLNSK